MRLWGLGGFSLAITAMLAVLSGVLFSVAIPAPRTDPGSGPVLETVSPAQLGVMNVRLERTVQPVQLPGWLDSLGVRPPATILLRSDAEAAVRKNSGGIRKLTEEVLTFATLARSPRGRGPIVVHRLVWAVVGSRTSAGSAGGVDQVLWLVDAHSGRQLAELLVPAVRAPGPASSPAPAAGAGP